MFDVEEVKFQSIASNVKHQTSNIKEKGNAMMVYCIHVTVPTNHEPLLLSQEEFHGRIISPGRLFRKCTHRH